MLNKFVRVYKLVFDKKIYIEFLYGNLVGREVLKVKGLSIGYEVFLVEFIEFIVRKGEKVVIIGKNGVGKLIMIKILMGIILLFEGSFDWIDNI